MEHAKQAHNRLHKDQSSILAAQCILKCFLNLLKPQVGASLLNLALGVPGTLIHEARRSLLHLDLASYRAGATRLRSFGPAMSSGALLCRKALAWRNIDSAMAHTAITEKSNGKAVDWLEKVSDEEYQAAQHVIAAAI